MDILYSVHREKSNVFLDFCILYKNLINYGSILCTTSFPWAKCCKYRADRRFLPFILAVFLQRNVKMYKPGRFCDEPAGCISIYYIVSYSFLALYSLYISSVANRS